MAHKVSNDSYLVLHRKHLLIPGLNNDIFYMFLVKQKKYKLVTLYVEIVNFLFLVSVFLCSNVLHIWKTCCMTASCLRSSRPFRIIKRGKLSSGHSTIKSHTAIQGLRKGIQKSICASVLLLTVS